MRILDRYLIKSFVSALLYCLAVFFILFIIIDLFNNLDEFLKNGVSIRVMLTYYGYFIPTILVQVVPIACLVAVLFVLGNLSRHNEIVALKASGVSAFHILVPYFFIGILISFGVLLVSEMVTPNSSLTSASIMEGVIKKGKKGLEDRALQKVTLYGKDNRMIYAREYEISAQTLHDIVIFENNMREASQTEVKAKRGRYRNGKWTFYDVIQCRTNRRGEIVGSPVFTPEMTYPLDQKPEDFIHQGTEVAFMNSKQLKNHIEHLQNASTKLVQKLSVDLHYKIAFPFVSFIVMLIGAPLAMKTGRGGTVVGIGTSFALVFLYYGIASTCLALGKGNYLPPVFAAWFGNLLFAVVGLYLIKNTTSQPPQTKKTPGDLSPGVFRSAFLRSHFPSRQVFLLRF